MVWKRPGRVLVFKLIQVLGEFFDLHSIMMYPSQSIKLVKDDLKHVPSLTGTEIVGMKLEPPGEKIAQSGAKKVSKARTTAELSSLLHLHIST
jgi:hypothetical protein